MNSDDGEEHGGGADEAVDHGEDAHADQVHRPRDRRHERVLDRPLPALPRDRLGDDLEDDPEERPDHAADEQLRLELVARGRREADAAGDEHDRQGVRDRPEQEREIPQDVALDEVEVPLDDAVQRDRLVRGSAPAASGRYRRTPLREHLPLPVVVGLLVVVRAAGRGEERLLERLDAVPGLHLRRPARGTAARRGRAGRRGRRAPRPRACRACRAGSSSRSAPGSRG